MRPIHTYGTPESSGYGYFMLKNKWGDRPLAPGYESFDLAAQIVKRVGEDIYGIGFSGQGFLTPQTRLVALAGNADGPYMIGTEEEVASYLRRELRADRMCTEQWAKFRRKIQASTRT